MDKIVKKKDMGKEFESRIQKNAKDSGIYTYRIKDVNLPPDIRMRVKLGKNRYDFIFFHNKILIPSELKSTKSMSFSFGGSNPKIKPHQLEALTEDIQYKNVIPTLTLNFREPNNRAFIVPIHLFNLYVQAAEGMIEKTLDGRHNEKSIPLHIVEQIGIEIDNIKKRTRHTYSIKDALDELTNKYE